MTRASGRRLVVFALLLAAAPAGARTWPDCLRSGPKKTAPSSLAELRACQKKAARRVADQAKARGAPLTDAELDALGDHQRAEARRFLARPAVVVEGPAGPAPAPEAETDAKPSKPKDGIGQDPSAGTPSDAPAAMRGAVNAIRQRYKAAGLKKIPPEDAADFRAELEKSGGRMTPELDRLVDQKIGAASAAAPEPAEEKPADSDDGGAR